MLDHPPSSVVRVVKHLLVFWVGGEEKRMGSVGGLDGMRSDEERNGAGVWRKGIGVWEVGGEVGVGGSEGRVWGAAVRRGALARAYGSKRYARLDI